MMDLSDEEEESIEKIFEDELKKINETIIPEQEVVKLCKIGEGSFGKVYKGKYKGNLVAIKKIKLKEKTLKKYQLLLNEIKVIKTIDTREIPKFYGLMKRKGHYHFIFEFISGKTFKEVVPQMNYEEKLLALYKLSCILESFHSKKLIHGDIKPNNIMIQEDGTVIIIDFGESKIAKHTVTHTTMQKGTVTYMPPEQFLIDIDKYEDLNTEDCKPVPISTKSDIWSLGVMVSEVFSKSKPYDNIYVCGPDENLVIQRLMGQEPFPIPDDLNNDIKYIVERATKVNLEERANASEIKMLFEKLIQKEKEKKK